MNAALLIHAIVRQTKVLIAALATASGQRAQLASLANVVFADLVRELREQGLGNKVIADMFGMALRTYHRKLARLSASRTVIGKSLWEAVLGYIQQHGPLLRSEVMRRFMSDDEPTLRAVLLDLSESGLVRRDGNDDAMILVAAEQLPAGGGATLAPRVLEGMVLVALRRNGPLNLAGLAELVPEDASDLGWWRSRRNCDLLRAAPIWPTASAAARSCSTFGTGTHCRPAYSAISRACANKACSCGRR